MSCPNQDLEKEANQVEGEHQNVMVEHNADEKPQSFGELDSGMSWLIAISGFTINFVVFGTASIFGVYLNYYINNEFSDMSKSTLTLIGGLGPAIFSLCCLPAGIITGKIGNRLSIFIAAIVFALGLVITSFATQLWHLFVGQAIAIGISISLCFIPTVSIIPQWFEKHRGVALGISAAGSGVGGLVLAPMIQAIIDSIGIRWALRINALIGAIGLIICGFILRPRVHTHKQKKLICTKIIFDKKFILMWLMGFSLAFAYWTPFFYIPIYCRYYEIPATTSSLIVGLLNGGSAIGRIVMGQVSKHLGAINSMFLANLIVSLSFVLIWNFSTVSWSLFVFAIIFGFFSGAFFTLAALIAPQLFGIEKLTLVNGPFYTSLAPGFLAGSMISTAIVNASTSSNGFSINHLPMQFYLFACYLLSCLFLILLKLQLTKNIFDKL